MQLYAAAYEGTANVHLQFMNGQMPTPRYTMSIIVSSYQHCDEQQFQTLSCALYTFVFSNKARFSHVSTVTVTRLHSCSGKKIGVSLACIFFHLEITLPYLTLPYLTLPYLKYFLKIFLKLECISCPIVSKYELILRKYII